jgi:alpha-D-ribose 1-methylphosphonate 5-triphosphate synthase subunit PhnL
MLRVNDLRKMFNVHILGDKVIKGCNSVSFSVPKGCFLGLSGPSGVGKSSILKCIYRTYLPTSGEVWYDSLLFGRVNLAEIKDNMIIDIRHKEIGYVSQFLKVIPRVSAVDILADPLLKKNGISAMEAKKKARELLARLEIPAHLFDAYPATFSGGEQQRINIARAIIWKPRLLLLDEPTASLDSHSVSIVVALLKELRAQGTSMIGIFHDQELLTAITDSVYRL